MKRGYLLVKAIASSSGVGLLTLLASVLVTSADAFGQSLPSGFPTVDLDEQLDIQLNNGIQREARDQADSLVRQGGQAQRRGELESAIATWLQALDLYQQAGDLQGIGQTYNYLGIAYVNLGRYRQAEDAFRRRLGIARTLNDFQGQVYALNNVGTVLLKDGNLEAAQDTFLQALTVARSIKNREGEGLSLSNLGLVAAEVGNYSEAINRYEAALNFRSAAIDRLGQANTRNNLGDAYHAAKRQAEAQSSYRLARILAEDSRDLTNQFRALRGLVVSHSAAREYQLAFRSLNDYIALAQKEANRPEELTALRLFAELSQVTGNLSNARTYYIEAIALANAIGDTQEETFLRNDLAQILYEQR
jgi:tetratricopeptide (TPR) repeat protein